MGFLMLSEALNLTLTLTRALFGKKKSKNAVAREGYWSLAREGYWSLAREGYWSLAREGYWSKNDQVHKKFPSLR